MSTIDKQRIAAVRKLEQRGYTFAGDDWIHPANDAAAIAPTITDELHAMLVKRAECGLDPHAAWLPRELVR
jgi:hypothetical protein